MPRTAAHKIVYWFGSVGVTYPVLLERWLFSFPILLTSPASNFDTPGISRQPIYPDGEAACGPLSIVHVFVLRVLGF